MTFLPAVTRRVCGRNSVAQAGPDENAAAWLIQGARLCCRSFRSLWPMASASFRRKASRFALGSFGGNSIDPWDPLQRRDYAALRSLTGIAPVTKRSGKVPHRRQAPSLPRPARSNRTLPIRRDT